MPQVVEAPRRPEAPPIAANIQAQFHDTMKADLFREPALPLRPGTHSHLGSLIGIALKYFRNASDLAFGYPDGK